jgi:hypothetical protein
MQCMTWLAITALAVLGVAAAQNRPLLDDPAAAKTIDDFIGCVNKELTDLNKNRTVDITDTVSPCVPAKCTLTGTISFESDQDACTLFAGAGMTMPVYYPRVILSCPGKADNLRLRPSYDLCPNPIHGRNRMELAQDQTAVDLPKQTGSMIMADVTIDPAVKNKFVMIDPNGIKNMAVNGNGPGSRGCNHCHLDTNPKTLDKLLLATPINPFGKATTKRGMLDLAQYILFTNEPGQKANEKIAMTLPNVCDAMKKNKDAVLKYNVLPDAAALDLVINLCDKLSAYAAKAL